MLFNERFRYKDKMAGVNMASEQTPDSFGNSDDRNEQSMIRTDSYLLSKSGNLPKHFKVEEKGNELGKRVISAIGHQPVMEKNNGLHNEREKTGNTFEGFSDQVFYKRSEDSDAKPILEPSKEQVDTAAMASCNMIKPTKQESTSTAEKISEKEHSHNETDFIEDMRIFENVAEGDGGGQIKGPMEWIMRQILQDTDPRDIITQLMPGILVPSHLDDITLWKGVWELITEPKARKKLDNVNTLEDVVKLIDSSKKIIVLTGAGVSVSCGIPDFRSRDGIYARLSKDFPDLPDPQSMFDIHYFRRDQRPFFKFAKEIYPGQFKPSLSHRFIAALDKKGKLLRNYTQNIDTLEQAAGIKHVVQCHGSFATASCTNCKHHVSSDFIQNDIFNQVIPKCTKCHPDESTLAVMKPDIIFFGEGLPDAFYQNLDVDKLEADLLIVIGSSLKVRPVALIPDYLKPDVPQILINREPLHHFNFDVELLGNCDAIIDELCRRLGNDWSHVIEDYMMPPLNKEAIERMFDSSSESDSENSNGSDDAGTVMRDLSEEMRHVRPIRENEVSNEGEIKNASYLDTDRRSEVIDNQESVNHDIVDIRLDQIMVKDDKCSDDLDQKKSNDEIEGFDISQDSAERETKPVAEGKEGMEGMEIDLNAEEVKGRNNSRKRTIDDTCERCKNSQEIAEAKLSEVREVEPKVAEINVAEVKKTEVKVAEIEVAAVKEGNVYQSCRTDEDNGTTQGDLSKNKEEGCKCNVKGKRMKFDSPARNDDSLAEESFSDSKPTHSLGNRSEERISEKKKPRVNIRPSSPSFNKESVMEKFGFDEIYYLLVPPNRYIFHGAELNTHMRFRQESISSSSLDENRDTVGNANSELRLGDQREDETKGNSVIETPHFELPHEGSSNLGTSIGEPLYSETKNIETSNEKLGNLGASSEETQGPELSTNELPSTEVTEEKFSIEKVSSETPVSRVSEELPNEVLSKTTLVLPSQGSHTSENGGPKFSSVLCSTNPP